MCSTENPLVINDSSSAGVHEFSQSVPFHNARLPRVSAINSILATDYSCCWLEYWSPSTVSHHRIVCHKPQNKWYHGLLFTSQNLLSKQMQLFHIGLWDAGLHWNTTSSSVFQKIWIATLFKHIYILTYKLQFYFIPSNSGHFSQLPAWYL